MEGMPVIKKPDGTVEFIGREDPNNPPIFVKTPNKRYCNHCHKEFENDLTECPKCGHVFDDGKIECPICHKFFEYLVGDDVGDGKRGCEACWKPPTRKEHHEPQERPEGPTFD